MRGKLRRRIASLLALVMLIPGGFAAPLAAADSEPQVVYHETFVSGTGKTKKSGNADLQHKTDAHFDGNADGGALYVTNRTNDYDAADYYVSDIPLQAGNTYTVTALVYADPADMIGRDKLTIVTALVDFDNNSNYREYLAFDIEPGKPTLLARTFTVQDIDDTFRIQTDEAGKNVPYYIGEIKFVLTASGGSNQVVFFQSFEDDKYDGWSLTSWLDNSGGTFVVSGDYASDGAKSLKLTDRQSQNSQPMLNLTGITKSNRVYDVSLKVRLGAGAGDFRVVAKTATPLLKEEQYYSWIVNPTTVKSDGWTTLAKPDFGIPDQTFEVLIWLESADGNTLNSDIYIDEVRIVDVTPDDGGPVDTSGIFDDFEREDVGNWVRRFGSGDIEVTDKDNHTPGGSRSLKTTASAQYDGPLLDLQGKLARGHQYELSAWVKMAQGEQPTVLRISVQYGESSFANVSQNATVTDGEWVLLTGRYTQTVPPGEYLNAYVEVANDYGGARTFLIDDFELKYIGPVAGPNPDFTLPAIKELYKDRFLIGSIVNPGNFDDDIRSKMLKHHFNLLTAENAMKPEYAYKPGTREFDLADEIALAEQAIANGFKVHGHVLVWHSQSPDWLHTRVDNNGTPLRDTNGNILYLSKEEALANLRTHIRTVVQAIGDRVISWDVVNEAMNDNPPNPADWRDSLRRSGWYYAIGPDYIYEAYKTARQVIDENGWDIELYYNDYNDDNQNKATAIANMVKELNERYAAENNGKKLIDGIGMQSHYNLNTNPENVRATIERIIGLGLKVGITELDVMAGTNGTITEDQAIRQGYLYAQLFKLYKEYADHITRVTFWGVDDGTSWRAENSPLLFDSRYQAKPAYHAVIDPDKYIEEHPPAEKEYQQGTASYGTPVLDGTEEAIWNRAEELPIARYQTAHNGATGTARVLWDDRNLYVLIKVRDTELDQTSDLPYEQDSVEVFLDETNSKAPSYGPGIGQYRVNYENAATFNPESAAEGFESAVVVNGTNYTVEMKIPFKTIKPANGNKIGFDAQINDAKDGVRRSVAIWNDLSGQGWQDPSVFGVLTLTGKPGGGSSSPSPTTPAAPEPAVSDDGSVTVEPVVENGRAKASLSGDLLEQALGNAASDGDGGKTIVVEIGAADGANAVDVELPGTALAGGESYVIRLKTPHGTIDLPSNMLEGIAGDAESVTIAIATVNAEELDEAVRSRIGDRPAISLNVLVDGEAIAWNNPDAPVTVAIPYEPTAEELRNPDQIVILYIDGDGNATVVPNGRYDAEAGAVVFRTTHFSTYAVAHAAKTFRDLAQVPWAKQAVEAMTARDLIAGSGDDRFNPRATVSRAAFAAMLVRTLELGGNGDLTELEIAQQLGIIRGNAEGRLHPDAPLTRQDMMVMVDRALAAAGRPLPAGGSLSGYSDAGNVAGYARNSAAKLTAAGIVNGAGGKLNPADPLTRAEAAVILYRIWAD